MSCTAKEIVKQAEKWKGAKEGSTTHKKIIDTYNSHKPRARGYVLKYTDDWCAGFVSACAIAVDATDICPLEVSCPKLIDLAKKKGIWKESDNRVPKVGDWVLYDWEDSGKGDNKNTPNHVGIVVKVSTASKTFVVIEGNKSDKVAERTMKFNGKFIRGFIVPKYSEGSEDLVKIAKEVIRGEWGNGSDRKKKLEKAGYNYSDVQKVVNTILKK